MCSEYVRDGFKAKALHGDGLRPTSSAPGFKSESVRFQRVDLSWWAAGCQQMVYFAPQAGKF
jgi:hypothetical protein